MPSRSLAIAKVTLECVFFYLPLKTRNFIFLTSFRWRNLYEKICLVTIILKNTRLNVKSIPAIVRKKGALLLGKRKTLLTVQRGLIRVTGLSARCGNTAHGYMIMRWSFSSLYTPVHYNNNNCASRRAIMIRAFPMQPCAKDHFAEVPLVYSCGCASYYDGVARLALGTNAARRASKLSFFRLIACTPVCANARVL